MLRQAAAIFLILLLPNLLLVSQATGQEDDFGQSFATMTDAELWAEFQNCKDREAMLSLLDQIPLSVMAKHALAVHNSPKHEANFGRLVLHILWTEFQKDGELALYSERISRVLTWNDASRKYRVDASIFDVRPASVILQKTDDSLVEVPIKRLSRISVLRLEFYRSLRKKFPDRLPATRVQIENTIKIYSPRFWQDVLVARFAIESVDDLMDDGVYLLNAAGFPEQAPSLKLLAQNFMSGIDPSKPSGALMYFDGQNPVVIGFLPVTNTDELLDTISSYGMGIEENGQQWEIAAPSATLHAIEKNGWLFVSESRDYLSNLPPDPTIHIKDLSSHYVVSMSVNLQKLPPELKNRALSAVGDTPVTDLVITPFFLMSQPLGTNRFAFQTTQDMLRDAENITIGWGIDQIGKRLFFDWNATALKGTRLARRMEAAGALRSGFSGFYRENSAVAMHWASGLIDEDKPLLIEMNSQGKEQLLQLTDDISILGDDGQSIIKEVLGLWLDDVPPAIESGKVDMAGSLILSEDTADFVLAIYSDDGTKLERPLKKLFQTVEEKLNREIHTEWALESWENVKFHRMTIPLLPEDEQARTIFGSEVPIVIGVAPKAIYIGAGEDSLGSLKDAIGRSNSPQSPDLNGLRYTVGFQQIVDFHWNLSDAPLDEKAAWAKEASDHFKKVGQDRLNFSLQTTENSQSVQLEIQEGLLGLIKIGLQQGRGLGTGF